jgi:PAS domain S-box-containing protein
MDHHGRDPRPTDCLATPVEQPLSESERFARSTLDALSAHVAILDDTGRIIATNRAWRTFAEANQPVLVGMLEGANYLALFASADGAGAEHAAAIISGVQAVMRGERQEHVFESSCHCLRENRWFNARVTRFAGEGSLRIVVAHEDVTERRRAEEALRANESRYRAMFESSCDAMMTLAPPSWRFASGNPAMVAMFGARDVADLMSRTPWHCSPERQPDGRDSDEKALEMIETAVRKGSHFFEWEHTRIDGTVFPATVLLTRIDLAGETIVQGTIRDVTEQKLLEDEKERVAREVRDLYENAPCGYHSVDSRGIFVRINDTELSWLGYSREQLVGEKRFPDLMTPRSVEAFKRNFPVLLERGRVDGMEYELVRADGTTFPVLVNATAITDAAGRFLMSRCVVLDVTARKQAEKSIRELENRYRAILDQTFEFIGLMTPDGTLVEANRAALQFIGVKEADVLGRPFWETPWWTHSEEMQDRLRDAIKTAAAGEFVRFEATHPNAADNGIHHVDFSLKPLKNEDGQVVFLIPEGRDVTDQKRAEAALHESRETIRSHIEGAFDVIFSLNKKHELVFVSPAWESCLGHPTHKVIGKPLAAFMHSDDVTAFVDHLTRVLASGQGETTPPYRMKHAKGEWRSFVANVRPHVDRKGETQFIGLAMLLPAAPAGKG